MSIEIKLWNKVAEEYSKSDRAANNNLLNYTMLKEQLGENLKGKKLLDAGCGDGSFTNQLKNLGATVYAFDGSSKMIELAEQNYKDIIFNVNDLTKPLPYKHNFFDYIVCSLTLMDIFNIDVFLKEASRILKLNGKLIFSIVHPAFFIGEWQRNEKGEKTHKLVYDYYTHQTKTLNYWGETLHYHRPIGWYSKKLKEAGLLIEEIVESPKNLEHYDFIKEYKKRIPLFICFVAVPKPML